MDWLMAHGDGVNLRIRVQPRASRTEVAGLHNGALKIRLQAPPVDGRANQALLVFLANALGISKSRLQIRSGKRGQDKTIHIAGITAGRIHDSALGVDVPPA